MANISLSLAYQKLFASLYEGGLDNICRTAYEILGKPVLIVNDGLKKLAQYPDQLLGDALWDQLFLRGVFTPNIIWQLRDENLMESSEKSDYPS